MPVYARMGSTGGGGSFSGSSGSSFGTGSSSSFTSSSASSDKSSLGSIDITPFVWIIMVGGLLTIIWHFAYKSSETVRNFSDKWHLTGILNFIFACLSLDNTDNDDTNLLSPHLTLERFNFLTRDLTWVKPDKSTYIDEQLNQELLNTYNQAEYLYGDLIRKRIANKGTRFTELRQYLANNFYQTMTTEMRLKASEGEADNTVIDKAEIVELTETKVDGKKVIIAKIHAIGRDDEVQYNHDFDDSYKQTAWTDFVIFDTAFKPHKIANIIYGGHFHLNGQDFNNQETLDGDYEEHDYRNDEHDIF